MIEYYKNLSLENLPYINEEGLICWEEFKNIPEYEGLYQVSDLGRVKSLPKFVERLNGVMENRSEKILRQINNGKDYLSVELYNNKKHRKYVHRLVLLTFETDCKLVVDHKNHIRLDNRFSNLRYLTQRLNTSSPKNKPTPSSKYTGVVSTANKFKKWGAYIKINQKSYYLGGYKTEVEASNMYQDAVDKWETFSITPKGDTLIKNDKTFNSKNKGSKGVNNKIVLDRGTGIYYDSLIEACNALHLNYKHVSSMLCPTGRKVINKTSLIYV